MKTTIIATTTALVFCLPLCGQQANAPDTSGQNSAAMEQRIRELEDRVIALEGKIRNMQSAQPAQPQPAPRSATESTMRFSLGLSSSR